jgi:hypothetical protein
MLFVGLRVHFFRTSTLHLVLAAQVVGCGEASLATRREADRVPSAEADASAATAVPLSRDVDLCSGTAPALGWTHARETKGALLLLAGQGQLRLPDDDAGRVEINAMYAAPGATAAEVALTGSVEVKEGVNRLGLEEAGVRILEARLTAPTLELRLDLFSEATVASQSFELAAAESTRWLLCRPAGDSCDWRVPLVECSSDAGVVGLVQADFGHLGNLSLEVWRAYLGPDNYSHVLRAWGSLDNQGFELEDRADLLMDSQDIQGYAERFAVMFDEARGSECGIELTLPFDGAGALARTLNCDFEPIRDLPVVALAN